LKNSPLAIHRLTTRRIDVKENAEKNRENARSSVKTPTKNVEKMAYFGTHHKKPNIKATSRAVTDEQSATACLVCYRLLCPGDTEHQGFFSFIAIIRIGGIQLGEELFQLPKPQKRRKP
jgi:hypothetical protein